MTAIDRNFPVDYCIVSSGSGIYEFESGNMIYKTEIDLDDSAYIRDKLMELDCDFMIHCGLPDNHLFMYRRSGRYNLDFEKRLEYYREHGREIGGRSVFSERGVSQFLVIDLPEGTLFERIKDLFGDFTVIRHKISSGPCFFGIEDIPLRKPTGEGTFGKNFGGVCTGIRGPGYGVFPNRGNWVTKREPSKIGLEGLGRVPPPFWGKVPGKGPGRGVFSQGNRRFLEKTRGVSQLGWLDGFPGRPWGGSRGAPGGETRESFWVWARFLGESPFGGGEVGTLGVSDKKGLGEIPGGEPGAVHHMGRKGNSREKSRGKGPPGVFGTLGAAELRGKVFWPQGGGGNPKVLGVKDSFLPQPPGESSINSFGRGKFVAGGGHPRGKDSFQHT